MHPDIFFTPDYQGLFKDTAFGGKPTVFQAYGIEYSFYKRGIRNSEYCDLISPYGYSGPIEISNNFNWVDYLKQFHEYCLESHIVSEFARLHPFEGNHLGLPEENVVKSGDVVYIDLLKPTTYDKGCKAAVKKANRTAVRVLDSFTPEQFQHVYYQTMLRRNADISYYFPIKFFRQLSQLPGISLGAFHDGQLVSCLSVLAYGDYAHYFLSGTLPEARGLNANNLLLAEAIKWSQLHGYKIFNVGGTFAGDKGLLSFKKSFSDLTMPFYTYRKIHNQEVYNQLCVARGIEPASEGYFPAYRRA